MCFNAFILIYHLIFPNFNRFLYNKEKQKLYKDLEVCNAYINVPSIPTNEKVKEENAIISELEKKKKNEINSMDVDSAAEMMPLTKREIIEKVSQMNMDNSEVVNVLSKTPAKEEQINGPKDLDLNNGINHS